MALVHLVVTHLTTSLPLTPCRHHHPFRLHTLHRSHRQAKVNTDSKDAKFKEYQEEIAFLRDQVAQYEKGELPEMTRAVLDLTVPPLA